MLFSDRVEVMNSGGLPPTLTVEKLRVARWEGPLLKVASGALALAFLREPGTHQSIHAHSLLRRSNGQGARCVSGGTRTMNFPL